MFQIKADIPIDNPTNTLNEMEEGKPLIKFEIAGKNLNLIKTFAAMGFEGNTKRMGRSINNMRKQKYVIKGEGRKVEIQISKNAILKQIILEIRNPPE